MITNDCQPLKLYACPKLQYLAAFMVRTDDRSACIDESGAMAVADRWKRFLNYILPGFTLLKLTVAKLVRALKT
jgi:hypothetical protein